LGKAKRLKKFPRLYANGVSVEHGKLILNDCPGLGVSPSYAVSGQDRGFE